MKKEVHFVLKHIRSTSKQCLLSLIITFNRCWIWRSAIATKVHCYLSLQRIERKYECTHTQTERWNTKQYKTVHHYHRIISMNHNTKANSSDISNRTFDKHSHTIGMHTTFVKCFWTHPSSCTRTEAERNEKFNPKNYEKNSDVSILSSIMYNGNFYGLKML